MMTPEELYEKLRPLQEAKGYFFNKDKTFVLDLMESLIINRDRYGFMACPCRLASGNRDLDKDILCPCVYREPDVAEFGACYCGLYVSKEWNEDAIPHETVPERRDPEKLMAGLLFED
jgi:ferredoxin-thioredoxin reductase catalytic subunit